jgi:large subunit ribosomal protein L19
LPNNAFFCYKSTNNIWLFGKKFVSLPYFLVISVKEELFDILRCNDNNLKNKIMDLIKIAEEAFATDKQYPSFKAGDTVTIAYRIIEGNKERIQLYRGVVIKISGHGDKKRFTVRKMSGTIGVERIFPMESPSIVSIEVNKIGKVRRAKLYYLRGLTGKKARIKEKKNLTINEE